MTPSASFELTGRVAQVTGGNGGILQETPDSWDWVIETQLNAVFLLSKIAAASTAKCRRGKIIIETSVSE